MVDEATVPTELEAVLITHTVDVGQEIRRTFEAMGFDLMLTTLKTDYAHPMLANSFARTPAGESAVKAWLVERCKRIERLATEPRLVFLEANLGAGGTPMYFDRALFVHLGNECPHLRFVLFHGSPDEMMDIRFKDLTGLSNVTEYQLLKSEVRATFENVNAKGEHLMHWRESTGEGTVPHQERAWNRLASIHDQGTSGLWSIESKVKANTRVTPPLPGHLVFKHAEGKRGGPHTPGKGRK